MKQLKRYKRLDMNEGVFDFVHIADKIKLFLSRKDKTGAFQYLAKTIGFQKYYDIFSHIQAIKKIEDRLPNSIVEYEDEIIKEMNEKAFKTFGNDYLVVLGVI